jgi:methyl-accepting chemotaxis protein
MRTTQAAQEAREKDIREAQQRQSEEESAQQAMVVNFLADGLERLSTGDLMLRLETEFPPGYEKLRQDFNSAIGTLRKTMQDIAVNAGGVQSGAIAITQSSDDITQRTEQQAARLEETAAALDEITTAVRKTASGAHAARDVVNAAKEDAERSGAVLNQTVIAMSGIETSSRQISNIIGVIDEIAFQTNLLALNAGVEAARAGDAGRGFAVVATEVRALAQRSADAAKEIKALISTSGAQVQTGVKLVAETSQALGRIVEQVTRLNILVNDIAASAQEQATGVAGVNEAVGMVDRVTQQNASKVTESASSAHALAGEARELVRLVGQFRIDTLVPAAAAWATPTSPPATRLAKPMATPARRPTTSPAPGRFAAVTESWDEF